MGVFDNGAKKINFPPLPTGLRVDCCRRSTPSFGKGPSGIGFRAGLIRRLRFLGDRFMKFALGQSAPRVEDLRLLRGGGRYTDDINLPGQALSFMLRSPVAHANIRSIDTTAALAAPGDRYRLRGIAASRRDR